MRKRSLALVTALGLLLAAPTSGSSASAAHTTIAAKACSSGYRHASLPWGHKCLRRGQFCKVSGDRHYHRYGYHCHGGRLR